MFAAPTPCTHPWGERDLGREIGEAAATVTDVGACADATSPTADPSTAPARRPIGRDVEPFRPLIKVRLQASRNAEIMVDSLSGTSRNGT